MTTPNFIMTTWCVSCITTQEVHLDFFLPLNLENVELKSNLVLFVKVIWEGSPLGKANWEPDSKMLANHIHIF